MRLDGGMRLLVIGGTRFVGRYLIEAALAAGHEVTLVHRSATELFPSARHVLADRNGDLSALAEGQWHATV
ncbi:MAG TPA: NAD-dependent epimerase/dehydratase family protein, partial [Nocardioidaceae bacterium]|nr:NAD-dependent epimerase/dehydratase family protein [Nocardioidaceae bacterium]